MRLYASVVPLLSVGTFGSNLFHQLVIFDHLGATFLPFCAGLTCDMMCSMEDHTPALIVASPGRLRDNLRVLLCACESITAVGLAGDGVVLQAGFRAEVVHSSQDQNAPLFDNQWHLG
jgi:hypothetical protein